MKQQQPTSYTLNHAHYLIEFTMEVESNGMLHILGIQLLNRTPQIETKVYWKPIITLNESRGQSLQAILIDNLSWSLLIVLLRRVRPFKDSFHATEVPAKTISLT